MKNRLFPEICKIKNLWQAWNKIKRKGSVGGIDNVSIKIFERKLEHHLKEISQLLQRETYIPEPTKRIFIPKDNLKEYRKIALPTIRDKIVQEATRSAIEPIFNSIFADNSFAYRPNRGPQKATYKVEHYIRQGNIWIATFDIDDFFDSINHNLLIKLISNKIWEKEILRLIELWLKMGIIEKNKWIELPLGIPQGGNISPLLSNIYLHQIDREMKNRGYNIIRYADNFICMEKTKRDVINVFRDAIEFLKKELLLNINSDSKSISNIYKGFIFLGFLFKNRKKVIADEKIEKIKTKIIKLLNENNDFKGTIDKLNESIIGRKRYYGIGEVDEQFKFLDNILFEKIKDYLKRKAFSKKESREQLQRLEFFTYMTEKEKSNYISLLIAASKINQLKKSENCSRKQKSHSISRDIAQKRRKYEKILSDASNLIVSSPGTFIGKTSSRVVVKEKRRKVKEIPFHRLKNILIASDGVSMSSNLVKRCIEENIPIIFLNYYGRPYAYVFSPRFPFYKIGMAQLSAINDNRGVCLAKLFVEGKIKNQINLIKYYRKYKNRKEFEFSEQCIENIARMQALLKKLSKMENGNTLEYLRPRIMNIEGQAAACYWSLIKLLLAKDVFFEGRKRRGAVDLVNSLLNYGYGILYSQVYQTIIFAGLNPNISFLHNEQFGKPTLVFDLIEEFRQPVVDKTIIGMIRKKEKLRMEGIYLSQETKQKVAKKILKRLNCKIKYRGKKTTLQEILKSQTKSMVKFLEEKEKYHPFIEKW